MAREKKTFFTQFTTTAGELLALRSATVSVFEGGTTNLAIIYETEGGVLKSNPFTSDSVTGEASFFADNSTYDIRVEKLGVDTVNFTNFTFDKDETNGANQAAFWDGSLGKFTSSEALEIYTNAASTQGIININLGTVGRKYTEKIKQDLDFATTNVVSPVGVGNVSEQSDLGFPIADDAIVTRAVFGAFSSTAELPVSLEVTRGSRSFIQFNDILGEDAACDFVVQRVKKFQFSTPLPELNSHNTFTVVGAQNTSDGASNYESRPVFRVGNKSVGEITPAIHDSNKPSGVGQGDAVPFTMAGGVFSIIDHNPTLEAESNFTTRISADALDEYMYTGLGGLSITPRIPSSSSQSQGSAFAIGGAPSANNFEGFTRLDKASFSISVKDVSPGETTSSGGATLLASSSLDSAFEVVSRSVSEPTGDLTSSPASLVFNAQIRNGAGPGVTGLSSSGNIAAFQNNGVNQVLIKSDAAIALETRSSTFSGAASLNLLAVDTDGALKFKDKSGTVTNLLEGGGGQARDSYIRGKNESSFSTTRVEYTFEYLTLYDDQNASIVVSRTTPLTLDITTTGAGGRAASENSGSEAASTWYYVFIYSDGAGSLNGLLTIQEDWADVVSNGDAPSGATYTRRISAVRNQANSNLLIFEQTDNLIGIQSLTTFNIGTLSGSSFVRVSIDDLCPDITTQIFGVMLSVPSGVAPARIACSNVVSDPDDALFMNWGGAESGRGYANFTIPITDPGFCDIVSFGGSGTVAFGLKGFKISL
jgi:hypothetical protein